MAILGDSAKGQIITWAYLSNWSLDTDVQWFTIYSEIMWDKTGSFELILEKKHQGNPLMTTYHTCQIHISKKEVLEAMNDLVTVSKGAAIWYL